MLTRPACQRHGSLDRARDALALSALHLVVGLETLLPKGRLSSVSRQNPYEFFLTGSSARRLRSGASNLMPGRAHAYHLHPLVAIEREGRGASHLLGLKSGASGMLRFRSTGIDQV